MQSLSDHEKLEVLGEVLMDELRAIREYVQDIPIMKRDIRDLKQQLIDHASRVGTLEYPVVGHDSAAY